MPESSPHIPVMLNEVLTHLNPQQNQVIVDCTFGAGGYSRAFLEQTHCRVIAIDRDPNVRIYAQKLVEEFGEDRFHFALTEFSKIKEVIQSVGLENVDSIVADLGISSMQIDEAARGFSFRHSAPLDMRMTPDAGRSAEDLLRDESVADLVHIFRHYGEERYAKRIAMAIDRVRQDSEITDTVQLAQLIRDNVPASYANGSLHPATRVFQALRIAVNDELGHVERLLEVIPTLLAPQGRFVCVSFHSLEDGLVKQALKRGFKAPEQGSRYLPQSEKNYFQPIWTQISKKPLQPTEQECQNNNRARSARLRWAERSP